MLIWLSIICPAFQDTINYGRVGGGTETKEKTMKKIKAIKDENLLRGVSTLDFAAKSLKQPILLLVLTMVFCGLIYANKGHSILDLVDPTFNPQISTVSFGVKTVSAIEVLPDGKILAAGKFNSYNRQPVGGLVRLNADGSLDTTFNNNVVETDKEYDGILVQPDGKIVLYGVAGIRRFNSDGTRDSNFNSAVLNVRDAAIDANGRIIIGGVFPNGKYVLRLNQDGSSDSSFNYNTTANISTAVHVATQNNKVIVYLSTAPAQVIRLNEDGSVDPTFTPANTESASADLIVQPDKKILVLAATFLQRLNENGDVDGSFQRVNFSASNFAKKMRLGSDGRITVATTQQATFQRFLPSGQIDQSFSPFNHRQYVSFALQSDGSVIIGDGLQGVYTGVGAPNWFARFFPNGTRDTSFNADGIGFQTILSGASQTYVRAVALHQDEKILIAGRFDEVNGVPRSKIARLNSDSTVDASFQINRSGDANYFSQIQEISNLRVQNDGKIIVTGAFVYVVNGVTKQNLVRLNPDGGIDSAFNLGVHINDYSFPNNTVGTIKIALFDDGKLLVGSTRLNSFELLPPLKLTATGAVDSSFNPNFTSDPSVSIYDVAIQPDGKILIGGRSGFGVTGPDFKSFIVRLNADGSTDQTFQAAQDAGKVVFTFALLPDGKIMIVRHNSHSNVTQSDVLRLNSNGSIDNSFNAGTGANGRINALLLLPNGKTMVGGKFTTFNGQPRGNLAVINADGTLDPMTFNVNQEVLSLTIDGQGRVLLGGAFTSISVDGAPNNARTYMARLIDSSAQATGRTRFDFDGDGKADLAVFAQSNGNWSVRNSQTNQTSDTRFGLSGDKTVAADYDNDGKTDLAVYRPSEGIWYLLRSSAGFAALRWGAAEDKPITGDFDGDGKADIAVWRPSNGVWYILQNGSNPVYHYFGTAGDVPLPADYDGDGKTDVAVFRPSSGTFYWLASGSNNQFKAVQFGQAGDIPAVADYNGDGKDDLVVFRPSNGIWYQYLTTQNGDYSFAALKFGQNGDEPVAADYNGDGKADIAVRRQGIWHMMMSGQSYASATFGTAEAQAIAALPNQ